MAQEECRNPDRQPCLPTLSDTGEAQNPPRVAGEAGAQEGVERSGGHEELVQAAVQPGGRHGVGGIGEGAACGEVRAEACGLSLCAPPSPTALSSPRL